MANQSFHKGGIVHNGHISTIQANAITASTIQTIGTGQPSMEQLLEHIDYLESCLISLEGRIEQLEA